MKQPLFFTRNLGFLRSFLAVALDLPRECLRDIVVTNPEILPDFASGKSCRLDLRLTVDGQVVNIEIQVENEWNFRERALFYWAKLLNETLKAGKDYKTIPKGHAEKASKKRYIGGIMNSTQGTFSDVEYASRKKKGKRRHCRRSFWRRWSGLSRGRR